MRTHTQSCDDLCTCLRAFITWWCVAPRQRCPNCCGGVSWPDGQGSDTTAPTEAASAGFSVRRTTSPADTPPPGKSVRSHGYLLHPQVISSCYCLRCFRPFGTFGCSLPQCLWSAVLRGCIGSECCPEPGPSGRIWIGYRPTSRCCPATKNKGNIRYATAWIKTG